MNNENPRRWQFSLKGIFVQLSLLAAFLALVQHASFRNPLGLICTALLPMVLATALGGGFFGSYAAGGRVGAALFIYTSAFLWTVAASPPR